MSDSWVRKGIVTNDCGVPQSEKEVGVVDADNSLVGLSGGVVTLHESDTRRLVLVPLAVIKSGCRVQVLGYQPAACKDVDIGKVRTNKSDAALG